MDPSGLGRALTEQEVEAFLQRQGYGQYIDDIFLRYDDDGMVYRDEVLGDVLVWRDPSAVWHYIAVNPEWAAEANKPTYSAPWFPPGDDPFAWLKTVLVIGGVIGGIVVYRELTRHG